MTRRQAIVSGAAAAVGLATGWRAEASDKVAANIAEPVKKMVGQTITGTLSGRPVFIPDANIPPMPSIAPPGPIYNGEPTKIFDLAVAHGSRGIWSSLRYEGCSYSLLA